MGVRERKIEATVSFTLWRNFSGAIVETRGNEVAITGKSKPSVLGNNSRCRPGTSGTKKYGYAQLLPILGVITA
jgi:hypothetical protein